MTTSTCQDHYHVPDHRPSSTDSLYETFCGLIFGDVVIHSHVGPVSRVTPVHTALRNCTRDEGRSFEVGNQVLISNHRKLLWSKAMVVNVAEKPEQDSGRYD